MMTSTKNAHCCWVHRRRRCTTTARRDGCSGRNGIDGSNRRGYTMLLVVLMAIFGLENVCISCRSYVIQPGIWKYKGHPIAYEHVSPILDDDARKAQRRISQQDPPEQALSSSSSNNNDNNGQNNQNNISPILLLNGFGVGSFHQHRLIQQLMRLHSRDFPDRDIYCIDYLGQGKSWPEHCQDGTSVNEQGLRYCGTTWVDQIVRFMEDVILNDNNNNGVEQEQGQDQAQQQQHTKHRKVHLVGNSVGGHLAVCIGAMRPDLVDTLCLLNPTPVWGLNLPGWCGTLPAPTIPKLVGRYLFDQIRDYSTIRSFLDEVYVNRDAYDDALMEQIRSCTEGDGGHAAFASILWSPPVTVPIVAAAATTTDATPQKNGPTTTTKYEIHGIGSDKDADNRIVADDDKVQYSNFDQCLRALQCDVLLMFGAKDPWCKPAFAKRMLNDLAQRPTDRQRYVHRYVELSQVGHCPNHEAPTAVAHVLSKWLDAQDAPPSPSPPSSTGSSSPRSPESLPLTEDGGEMRIQESWGITTLSERVADEIPLSLVDRLAITFV